MTSETEIYQKLQKRLDKLPIGYPSTESGVEIKILQELFTPVEADLAVFLNLLPETKETIYKRASSSLSLEDFETHLDNMAHKGIINRHIKRSGLKLYSIAMLAIGIFEFQVDHLTKEFYSNFKQYIDEAFRDEILQTRIPQLRTIPTEGSIGPDLPIATYDHIRTIINDFSGPIGVANCVCKQGQDLLGQSCKVTKHREICLVFGAAAVRYESEKWGRSITKDECFNILAQAEKDGLVVQPSNTEKPFAICLCCGCCCEILTSAKPLDNPVQYFATNYQAVVDMDLCIGCGICAKRCQMDAITIVEKKSIVDLGRCIGCGLCVTTCAKKAITLQKRDITFVPPKNSARLYMKILRKKIGNAKFLLMVTRQMLGNRMI